ncbi:MAG: LPS export ABC transporter periplasmic protein LptC [Alteraurantiacibacter sp.]
MTVAADQIRTRRQAFAAPGGSLDRIVRVLAVGLPMAVGVVSAMMLITPLGPRSEVSFLLDRNKVAVAEDRLRVDNAMYRGEDNSGRPFSLSAGEAVQTSGEVPVVEMRELVARILMADGPAVLSAPNGTYNIQTEQVAIPGTVSFAAADGYNIAARNVRIDLTTRTLVGNGRVTGAIPAGTFAADNFRADLPNRSLSLIGNASLRMVPGRLQMPRMPHRNR